MGRRGPAPKSNAEVRRHQVNARLNDDELVLLDRGRPEKITRGTWLRTLALNRKLPRPIPEINREAWAELARVAANLNQLTRHFNQGGGDLDAAMGEVAELRNKLIGVIE